MKSYVYDSKVYGRSVTGTGAFCILVGLYSVFMLLTGSPLFWVILLVSAYQVFNTFVSISNPREVTVSEEEICFSAYGKTHRYPLAEITTLLVKEIDPYRKMYVRVNEATLLRGRYWIQCKHMNDGRELWDFFAYLEYQKDPSLLKFRARIPKDPRDRGAEQTPDE